MIASFTLVSGNSKTGPIPTTMTEQASCPDACPFKAEKLCYPYFSPLGFMWESLDNNGYYKNQKRKSVTAITWDELCFEVSKLPRRQVWRHNTAGDLPGEGNYIDLQKFDKLVKANRGRMGFTYSHKPVGFSGQELINARAIYAANKSGFRVNLSADSLTEADELADMNIAPVVVVVPTDSPRYMKTPKGRTVITCPAEEKDDRGKPIIQCSRCQLCAKDREAIVAFRAHGTKQKAVNKKLVQLRLK